MSHFLALPPAASVRGAVRVPPSKSATNRALLLASLTDSPVEIVRPLASDDVDALRGCLSAMGASIAQIPDGLRVSGPLRGDPGREVALDARDSGTAARFLVAVCAVTPGRFLLTGSQRLRERPVGELVAALSGAGARIAHAGKPGCLPLRIEGGALARTQLAVDASRSSQFLSALLLAAVAVDGGLEVRASGVVVSAPYVEMTLETLRAFGHAAGGSDAYRVTRGPRIAARYEVPGDYSSAVPLLAAAGVAGGGVTVTGLAWPSADADAGALAVLARMGVRIDGGTSGVTASGTGGLAAVTADAADFPDSVPALAALAALAPGESRLTGIAHLRLKESDRLAALVEILGAAGARAHATDDALVVTGPPRAHRTPVRIPTFRDHRMAMAAALLAIRLPGLLIEDPACVSKSYPAFFRDLESVLER